MKNKNLDNFFKSRSDSFNEMPSDDLWKKIQNNLSQEPKPKLNFKKTFFMTFTIIALFSVTTLILNINDNPEKIDKTVLNHDSVKKEKLLIVLDTNVQLKSSPNRLGLKTIIPANKTPNKKTTSKNNALTPKISVKTSKTDVNNLQSIIKKDLKTQDVYSESLKNDTLNNTNELIIETIGSNTQIISKNVIEISETSSFQEKIYPMDDVDVKPEFYGGINRLYVFIYKKFRTPKECPGGKITVTFVIEKDGSLTDIRTLKDVGFGTGTEAIRVLKESPKWKPGKQDGKTVRVQYILPITIQPAENSDFSDSQDNSPVFSMAGINVQPEFIGGKEKLYEFINQNYRIPEGCPSGKIYIGFIIEKDGSLTNIKVQKWIQSDKKEFDPKISKLLIEEIIRVLNICPKWEPGEQDGQKVRVFNSIPISIK